MIQFSYSRQTFRLDRNGNDQLGHVAWEMHMTPMYCRLWVQSPTAKLKTTSLQLQLLVWLLAPAHTGNGPCHVWLSTLPRGLSLACLNHMEIFRRPRHHFYCPILCSLLPHQVLLTLPSVWAVGPSLTDVFSQSDCRHNAQESMFSLIVLDKDGQLCHHLQCQHPKRPQVQVSGLRSEARSSL